MADTNFVSKLVKDPSALPRLAYVVGYLGKASREKSVRIYFDPSLASYVDVGENTIRHQEDVEGGGLPKGALHLWIEADALGVAKQYEAGGGVPGAFGFPLPPGPPMTPFIPCGTSNPTPCGPCIATPIRPCRTTNPTPCTPCVTRTTTPCAPCPSPRTACPPCPTNPGPCLTPTCPYTRFCPQTQFCPPTQAFCPTSIAPLCGGPIDTALTCPSAVDACPSTWGCQFPGDFSTPVVQQQTGFAQNPGAGFDWARFGWGGGW
jgi:hypothetical protein